MYENCNKYTENSDTNEDILQYCLRRQHILFTQYGFSQQVKVEIF